MIPLTSKEYLNVHELASLFGLNVQTLLYYDKVGVFKPSDRDPGNRYRKYRFDQIKREKEASRHRPKLCKRADPDHSGPQYRHNIRRRNDQESVKEFFGPLHVRMHQKRKEPHRYDSHTEQIPVHESESASLNCSLCKIEHRA